MIFFIIANFGFNSANVFYDAFLPEVSTPETIGKVSGYGWAFGYVGGLVSLLVSLVLLKINVRLIFPMIALHHFLFSLFTFFWLKELKRPSQRSNYLKIGFRRVWWSMRNLRKLPNLLRFIISFFIYNDGITTVIVFASIYALPVWHDHSGYDHILYLGAVYLHCRAAVFGKLTDVTNTKTSLSLSILIWIGGNLGFLFRVRQVLLRGFACRSGYWQLSGK